MQKILLFFKRSFVCLLLSFSLLCNNTAAVTYQAAAIPVVYTGWQVFVTIFSLLGITLLSAGAEAEAEEESAKELADKFVGWKVLKGEGQGDNNNDGEDDLYAAFDIMDYLDGDKLVIPDQVLQDFKEFYHDNMSAPPLVKPSSSVDLSKMNYQEFCDWFYPYLGLERFSDFPKLNYFCADMYNTLAANNYSGAIFKKDNSTFVFDVLTNSYGYEPYIGWKETSNNNTYAFTKFDNSSSYAIFGDSCSYFYLSDTNNDSTWGSFAAAYRRRIDSSSCEILAFIVNGRLYDTSIFTLPINATTNYDSGSRFHLTDFIRPTNNLSNAFQDITNSIGDLDLGDKIYDDVFDVIGDGRDYDSDKQQAVGDITIQMPTGDAITDYQNGLISYEDFLKQLGVTPIDKAEGTNLLTQEFLDTQTGIFDGVKSLVDLVKNIWDFLANLIGNLIDALISMFVSLFVPSEGYFIEYFNRVDALFESALGFLYTPFDLLFGLFDAMSSSSFGSTQLYFPGIKFQEYVLCEPMYVELDLRDEFPALYRYMHFITNTILIGAVLWLMQIKAKEVIKN